MSNTERTGARKHPLHRTWCGMRSRCQNAYCLEYPDYGGRGIVVCERWSQSFWNFVDDMGPRPDGHTLDRIDNDGPYSPGNCRWAGRQLQANNRRSNRLVTYGNTECTVSDLARLVGKSYRTLYERIHKSGWSVDRAVNTPEPEGRRGRG